VHIGCYGSNDWGSVVDEQQGVTISGHDVRALAQRVVDERGHNQPPARVIALAYFALAMLDDAQQDAGVAFEHRV
jgi:hypothetical protein